MMETIQFTDFRNHAKDYIDNVEHGESFVIVRRGRPVAKVIPIAGGTVEGWKRKIKPIKLSKGILISDILRQDRDAK